MKVLSWRLLHLPRHTLPFQQSTRHSAMPPQFTHPRTIHLMNYYLSVIIALPQPIPTIFVNLNVDIYASSLSGCRRFTYRLPFFRSSFFFFLFLPLLCFLFPKFLLIPTGNLSVFMHEWSSAHRGSGIELTCVVMMLTLLHLMSGQGSLKKSRK